jgi:hypothetical protein
MNAAMIDANLARARTEVLSYIQAHENVHFSALIEDVSRNLALDQSTIKAAVLRLQSEGVVDITSEWIVRPVPSSIAAA